MTIFLLISILVCILCLGIVFFSVSQKISILNKALFSVLSIASISLLLFKVVDFSALENKAKLNQDTQTELLKARQNPNDIVAWNDLGRAYLLEKEYVNAYMAFTQSEQLDNYVGLGIGEQQAISERLKWVTGLAEARILAQGGRIDEQANKFIQRSLQLDKNHPKALWYGGLAAAQNGNYQEADKLWKSLIAQKPPQALQTILQQRLDAVAKAIQLENASQASNAWELQFKLNLSEKLVQLQGPKTKIYASIRQAKQAPPIIAKAFTLEQLSEQENKTLSLSQNDSISGMGLNQALDWDKPSYLIFIWAPVGNALDANNVRLELEITRENLDSVFEYTLE